MTTIGEKADYVRRARQTRDHACHWPGCEKQCKPAQWGCLEHWRRLPKRLRDKIWLTFRPGQETNWTPSRAYVEAAREVQEWIAQQTGKTILVCGYRSFLGRSLLRATLDAVHRETPLRGLISGKGGNVDLWAAEWGRENLSRVTEFPADWDNIDKPDAVILYRNGRPYNAKAGPDRNALMAETNPDIVLAVVDHTNWRGTPGTNDMLGRMRAKRHPDIRVVRDDYVDPIKAALSAFLATHAIKLVHIWNVGDRVNAMLEWPYDPVRKKPMETQKHATGVGDDAIAAVTNALDLMGHNGLSFRLFVLAYMIEMNSRLR